MYDALAERGELAAQGTRSVFLRPSGCPLSTLCGQLAGSRQWLPDSSWPVITDAL